MVLGANNSENELNITPDTSPFSPGLFFALLLHP